MCIYIIYYIDYILVTIYIWVHRGCWRILPLQWSSKPRFSSAPGVVGRSGVQRKTLCLRVPSEETAADLRCPCRSSCLKVARLMVTPCWQTQKSWQSFWNLASFCEWSPLYNIAQVSVFISSSFSFWDDHLRTMPLARNVTVVLWAPRVKLMLIAETRAIFIDCRKIWRSGSDVDMGFSMFLWT